MPTVTYRSTDAGAPVLNGTVGSLAGVLDLLVNGNATAGKAAAGWTKPFSGSNLHVYRGATSGSGLGSYVNLDDAGNSPVAGAREANLRGALTASQTNARGAAAGMTEPTPTVAIGAVGACVLKSATLDSTARGYILHADAKSFTLLTFPGNLLGYSGCYAGEIASDTAADGFRFALIGRELEHEPRGDVNLDVRERFAELVATPATGLAGHFMMRSIFAGQAGQVATTYGKHCTDGHKRNLVPYIAGRPIQQAAIALHEDVGVNGLVRGRLRGVWDSLHVPWAFPFGTTWSGLAGTPLAGKTFEWVGPLSLTNVALTSMAGVILETSDTWETSV